MTEKNQDVEIVENKTEKEKKKKNPKNIANWSLLLMGAGWASTIPFTENQGLELLHRGFEAGLIGGVSDLFAVTAIFKHPLKIQIPHTALLPKNRNKITKGIITAVEKELLNKEILFEKMKNVNFSNIAIQKIEDYIETEEFIKIVKNIKEKIIDELDKNEFKKVKEELQTILKEKEKEIKTTDLFNKLVDKVIENKVDEKILEEIIELIEKKYQDDEVRKEINNIVINAIEKKAENGFLKLALAPILALGKEKIDSTIEKTIEDTIEDLKNENSSTRFKIKKSIKLEINSLKENKELNSKIENARNGYLNGEFYQKVINDGIEIGKREIIKKIEDEKFETFIKENTKKIIKKIKNNEETKEKIESKIKEIIGKTIENNHEKIGLMIEENLNKMSNEQITAMIEDKVGKDLAWIRISGALCGFIVGIGLTGIKMIFG